MDRGSETQLQVGENIDTITLRVDPFLSVQITVLGNEISFSTQ